MSLLHHGLTPGCSSSRDGPALRWAQARPHTLRCSRVTSCTATDAPRCTKKSHTGHQNDLSWFKPSQQLSLSILVRCSEQLLPCPPKKGNSLFQSPQTCHLNLFYFLKHLIKKIISLKEAFYFKIVFCPPNSHLNIVSFQVEKTPISCSLVTEGKNLTFEHTLLQETTRKGWLGYSVTAIPRKHSSCWAGVICSLSTRDLSVLCHIR